MSEKPSLANSRPRPGMANESVRFGSFEVDRRAGELRKSGVKIRLQGQPFEVLALLLEQPGQLVTREELQQRLWAGIPLLISNTDSTRPLAGYARRF